MIHTGGPKEGMLGKKATNCNIDIEVRSGPQLKNLRFLTMSTFYFCSKKCALNLVRQVHGDTQVDQEVL